MKSKFTVVIFPHPLDPPQLTNLHQQTDHQHQPQPPGQHQLQPSTLTGHLLLQQQHHGVNHHQQLHQHSSLQHQVHLQALPSNLQQLLLEDNLDDDDDEFYCFINCFISAIISLLLSLTMLMLTSGIFSAISSMSRAF